MSFPRYPKYKASGVEWLGEVPEHWEVTALKRGYQVTLGKMLQPESAGPDDELLPYLRAANIQWAGVDTTDIKQMWLSKRDQTQLRLEAGDLLVSEGGDVGRSCLWYSEIEECYFQNSVNRVRARDGNSNRYLCYWMSTIKDKGYIDVLCNKSTIAHFTAEKVEAVPVPFPPSNEQTAIAAFLDRETGKIDALVAEQRRLMELLKEKRQAVISHAVTKGLNPHAPMKPSGIEWLGPVPEHWTVRRVSSLSTKITNGYVGPTRDILKNEGVRYLQSLHIKSNEIRFDTPYFVSEEWSLEHSKSILEAGDVLIVQTGDIGQSAVVPEEFVGCNCHALIIVAPVRSVVDGSWIAWVLNSDYGFHSLLSIQTGALHPHLNCGDIKDVIIPLPPLKEQREIVAYILAESHRFDTLTAEAQRAIDLLHERRTALISAAVTGQIDLRETVRGQS
jgi:type I restriction enzyme S subunit